MSFIPNPQCKWVTATHGTRVKVQDVGYAGAEYTVGNLGIYVMAIKNKVLQVVPFSLLLPEAMRAQRIEILQQMVRAGGPLPEALTLAPKTTVHGESIDTFATYPEIKIDMAGGGFDPAHTSGPFKIVCDDAVVEGMGLPLNHHVIYVVTFRVVATAT